MLDAVRYTIKKSHLISKGDKVVVGVSGGPDSTALLYCLYALRKEFRLRLHIVHVDHGLRKGSHRDRIYVEALARQLGLPITCGSVKVKAYPGSLEEAARTARFSFLGKVLKETGADAIALGHNRDDQAETVLMRILRGSGLLGLSAILPQRTINGCRVIRPLLDADRKDIAAFLRKKGIRPRVDPTNLKNLYFRNKIRNKLLPLLEREYNTNIREVLSSMAETAAYDYDYLYRRASSAMKRAYGSSGFDLRSFSRLHPAMQRLLLRLAIQRLKGDTRRITFRHARELEDLLANRPSGSVVDLPRGISAVKRKKNLMFYVSAERCAGKK